MHKLILAELKYLSLLGKYWLAVGKYAVAQSKTATGQQLFMNFKLLQNDVFFLGELSAFIGPLIH